MLVIAVSLIAWPCLIFSQEPRSYIEKTVLVTGASTGIGRKIAERLASDGYYVFAGARKDGDIAALSSIKNVQGIRLDVTSAQDIAAAVETVRKTKRGLYAVINNAGVFSVGGVADSSMDEFDLVMAVNVAGPFRITKAFLPMIIADRGRIVTIGSITGFFGCAGANPYCMSKNAMEAFTDGLADEVAPFGVQVSVIEPGQFKSQIWMSAAKRGDVDRKTAEQWTSEQKDPEEVASATALALSEKVPKRRYLVASNQLEAKTVLSGEITRLVQTNEGHAYTYDRQDIVAMLDEALAHSRPRKK
jgi:NAD(P)-dependent dehydrogenase (short-subunit alcohol dehydrogenase family)